MLGLFTAGISLCIHVLRVSFWGRTGIFRLGRDGQMFSLDLTVYSKYYMYFLCVFLSLNDATYPFRLWCKSLPIICALPFASLFLPLPLTRAEVAWPEPDLQNPCEYDSETSEQTNRWIMKAQVSGRHSKMQAHSFKVETQKVGKCVSMAASLCSCYSFFIALWAGDIFNSLPIASPVQVKPGRGWLSSMPSSVKRG